MHESPQKADNCTNRHFAEMTFQDERAFLMMSWNAHMPKKPNTQYHRGSHRGKVKLSNQLECNRAAGQKVVGGEIFGDEGPSYLCHNICNLASYTTSTLSSPTPQTL